MAQLALDPASGEAPMLTCRVLNEDMARLARLAARRGASRSETTRELLRAALDRAEAEDIPPPDGG